MSVAVFPSNITTQGNVFNGASQLVQLDGSGKLPAVDGSQLTGISGGGSLASNAMGVLGTWVVGTDATIAGKCVLTVTGSTWSVATGLGLTLNAVDSAGINRFQYFSMIRGGLDYLLIWKDSQNFGSAEVGSLDASGNPVLVVNLQNIGAGGHGSVPSIGDTILIKLFYSDVEDLSGYSTTVQMNSAIDSAIGSFGNNLTTAQVPASTNLRYVTDAELVVIGNTSGTNTGDQDLSTYLPITTAASTYALQATTVNGQLLNANVTLTTADIADSTGKRYVTDADLVLLGNTSNTNTGDQDLSSYVTDTALASALMPYVLTSSLPTLDATLPYSPGSPSNWSGSPPTEIVQALDRIATAVVSAAVGMPIA